MAAIVPVLALILSCAVLPGAHAVGAPVPVPAVTLPAQVDAAPTYVGQSGCNPIDTQGVIALRSLLLATYGPAVIGGARACRNSVSEHFDGRALDWMRSVHDPGQALQVETFLAWLLAPAADGTGQEMARRLGIMYLIWNNRMIRMYDPGLGWTEYKGCQSAAKASTRLDTTCHRNHLHISLSWDGANVRTSWWTGVALRSPGSAASAPAAISPVISPIWSTTTIPARVPGQPRAVSASLRKGAILVTWKAPASAASVQVEAYLVSARAGSRYGPVAGTCLATRSARICWLPNLQRGIRYWVAVSATNLAGPSKAALRSVALS